MKIKSKTRKLIVFIALWIFYPPITHSQLFNPSCYEAFAEDLISRLKNSKMEEISEILKTKDVSWPVFLRRLLESERERKPFNRDEIIRAVGGIKPDSLAESLQELREKISDKDQLFIAQVITHSLQERLPHPDSGRDRFGSKSEISRQRKTSENSSQISINEGVASLRPKDIGRIYKILFEQGIVPFSAIKWSRENKHDESLTGEVKDTRKEIYELFKKHPEYIPVKTLRRLADIKKPGYTKSQKIYHIQILKEFSKKKTLKDTLTIQGLGEGLTDFDTHVRVETAEALGHILSKDMGIFKDKFFLQMLTQPPLNYLLPLLVAYSLTPNELSLIVDSLFLLAVIPGLSLWHLFSTDPSQTRDIRWHIAEQLKKAVYDPETEVKQSAVQSIGRIGRKKEVYPFLIDALIESLAFSSVDEVKQHAIKSLRDSIKNGVLSKLYFLSGFKYEERKEENVINRIVKPLYGVSERDEKYPYRHVIWDYLEKKSIKPKKYYSAQSKKARELKREKTRKEKGIKTIRPDSNNNEPPPFDSWFEVDVFLELHNKGYIVIPQFPVPRDNNDSSFHYIDLVVLDSKNPQNRLAVECDGEGYHSGKQREDSERQQALEKKGWNFQRVTSSEFYSENKDLSGLWEKLRAMEIKPVK